MDIVTGLKKVSIKLFENMNKSSALEVYEFIVKYKTVLNINDETIQKIKTVLLEKYKNTYMFILNPSLDDLFASNVYKLVVNKHTYFVPLWHSELYYEQSSIEDEECDINNYKNYKDSKDNVEDYKNNGITDANDIEIIVKCMPDLPDNIMIDEYNNVHITINVCFNSINIKESHLLFTIGKQSFQIPHNELLIKSVQYYTIRKKGIAMIDEKFTYNTDNISDVIVKIIFY
jgi:hypothetical protein